MMVISRAVYELLGIISWLIVIKSFLTWLPDRGGKMYDVLSVMTEPLEAPIRNITSRFNTMFMDFTPMIAIIVIMLLRQILLAAMYL